MVLRGVVHWGKRLHQGDALQKVDEDCAEYAYSLVVGRGGGCLDGVGERSKRQWVCSGAALMGSNGKEELAWRVERGNDDCQYPRV